MKTSITTGAAIRALRTAKGLTLSDLASKAEMDKGHLSRIERDQVAPSLERLRSIARALGVRPGRLVDAQSAA